MPAIFSKAPGKIILFGEHAVVYGQPAIAVPVHQVQAKAVITPNPLSEPGEIIIDAPQVNLLAEWSSLPENNPLVFVIHTTLTHLRVVRPPAMTIRVTSTIPIASGLGSGAAVSIAIIRAISNYLGIQLPVDEVSALAYEAEKIHHGHPSGVDNTVIAYGAPVYFEKNHPCQLFDIPVPFTIVIGDTGISAVTGDVVKDVRQKWEVNLDEYNRIFSSIGEISRNAYQSIIQGENRRLGEWMDENQSLLKKIDVSSPELDQLIDAARRAGALGAKLSGGGRGGNMIALTEPDQADTIAAVLKQAGARNTIITEIKTISS